MNTTPAETSEIQQLRQELDALKKEFQDLRRFLRVDPPAAEGQPPTLNLACTTLSLCSPQGQQRGLLLADDTGACLSLYGNDLAERIFLGVEDDATLLSFQNAAQETTLQLYAAAESGRGEISVFENGTPRAVVKAFDGGFGSVAVTNEDGTPSVGMCSLKTGGQLVLMNPEKKIVVRLASDTEMAPEGGMIFVSRKDGQPVVGMNASAGGGAVMVMDEKDFSVALMNGQHGGGLHIKAADKKSSINLLGAANGHSGITINGPENHPVAQLCGEANGGALIIQDQQDRERAVLRLAAGGEPFLALNTGAEKNHAVLLTAFKDKGALFLENPRGDVGGLNMEDGGGGLTFIQKQGEQPVVQLYLGFDDKSAGLHLRPQPNLHSAASLSTQAEGGLLLVAAPDGTRRAQVCALNNGGQLALFSDLGIERALLGSFDDGGGLKLKWGGTPSVIALATDKGGCVVANDGDGKPAASLPPRDDDGDDWKKWTDD